MAIMQIDPPAEFPLFHPASAGDDGVRSLLTVLSVKQTIPNLENLVRQLGLSSDIMDLTTFAKTASDLKAAEELGSLLKFYGSDKSIAHNYNLLYGPILLKNDKGGLLEVGIGSNNTKIVSNMGATHRPGGSLRAFRDFTGSEVYGADFDKEILFEEELIKCYFVDQTEPSTFQSLDVHVPDGLDLVIDDGLHAPNANLATLSYGLKKVREGGWVVIEDIGVASLAIWQVVYALISRDFECYLLQGKVHFIFAVCKK